MAGILVPSAAIVHLRPQRGDADASWPVGKSGREGQIYRTRFTVRMDRKRDYKQVYAGSILHLTPTQLTNKILFGGVGSWCAGAWFNPL